MIRQHTPETFGNNPGNKTLLRYLAASQGNPVSTTLEHMLTDAELSEPIEFDPLEQLEVLSMQGQSMHSHNFSFRPASMYAGQVPAAID